MKMYIATLIYESSSDRAEDSPLFEEAFLAVKAVSEAEARAKVATYVANSTHSYKNEAGDTITWSLKLLVSLQPALSETLPDGEEIYARHFRDFATYQAIFLGKL